MSSQQIAPLTKGCSNKTTSRRSSKSSAAWKWTLDCLVGVETRPELEAGVAAVEESSLWPEFSAESMSLITLDENIVGLVTTAKPYLRTF